MDEIFNVELTRPESTENMDYAALTLPAPPCALLDALEQIGAKADEPLSIDIVRYHSFEFLAPILEEPDSLAELNALAQRLAVLNPRQKAALEGLAEMEYAHRQALVPVSKILDFAYGTGCCHVLEEVGSDAQLGRFLAESGLIPGADRLPDALFDRLDFVQIGREHRQSKGGVFTRGGYVEKHSEPPEISKMSTPVRFCNFSPDRKCHKTAGKGVQPLNNYTRRFRPSSLNCTDKSGLDGLQADE